MDSTVITAIISAVGLIIGYIVKGAVEGWSESRRGRKDEAHKTADERDRLRAERDAQRHRSNRWADRFWATRAISMRKGVPPTELPQPPQDNLGDEADLEEDIDVNVTINKKGN